MSSGNQTSHIKELDGNGSFALDARAIVRLASLSNIKSCTGTVNLQIAYCPLGIYGSESEQSLELELMEAVWFIREIA